jgi:hypothetical protein
MLNMPASFMGPRRAAQVLRLHTQRPGQLTYARTSTATTKRWPKPLHEFRETQSGLGYCGPALVAALMMASAI